MNYNGYINSPAWWTRRLEHFKASPDNARCYVCNWHGRKSLHVHHITYERIGHEASTDLVSLCRDCHAFVHYLEKKCGVPLLEAHIVAKARKAAGEPIPTISERREMRKKHKPQKRYKVRGTQKNMDRRTEKLKQSCTNMRGHITCIHNSLATHQKVLADAAYFALEKLQQSL